MGAIYALAILVSFISCLALSRSPMNEICEAAEAAIHSKNWETRYAFWLVMGCAATLVILILR